MARIKVQGSPTILTKFSWPDHFVLKVLLKGFELYVTKKLFWSNFMYERVARKGRTTNHGPFKKGLKRRKQVKNKHPGSFP